MVKLFNSIALVLFLSITVFSHIISSDENAIDVYENVLVIVECPADITISCTESNDPSNTGMATVSTGELASRSDSIILMCPNQIIRRTWFSTLNGEKTDSCVQMITVNIDSVMNEDPGLTQFSGFCASDLDSLARDFYNLNCNESFVSVFNVPIDPSRCGAQSYRTTYAILDNCTGQERSVIRNFQLIDIPPVSLTNVVIDSAEVSDGNINLEIVMCQDANLTYAWTDDEGTTVSTDSILTNVRAGSYKFTISSNTGCIDSFLYTIPQIGAIFINCPQNVTLGCNEDVNDINLTGQATSSSGDLSFTTDTIQMCPILMVERTWRLRDGSISLDSCVQTITVQNSMINNSDTLRFMNMCPEPISSFIQNIDLQCSQSLDSTSQRMLNDDCNSASYEVTFFITDACQDSSFERTQLLEFTNVPFITISDIRILPDAGDSTGSISFDYTQCKEGDLTFAWSNGSSDTSLSMLSAGSYTLTVTGSTMCEETFSFDVSLLSDDIICPDNVTVSCDASIDPINLGYPTGGAQEDFTYSDTIVQQCPSTMIMRRWSRNVMSASLDMCTQMITLDPQGVRSSFPDTTIVTGICGDDLEAFVDKDLPLSCGEIIIEVRTTLESSSCDEVIYSTLWFGRDDCNGGASFSAEQVTIFREIPVVMLQNIMISPDPTGMGGAISFDANACKNDMLTYAWSNGSTDDSIDSLNAGGYSVTITNEDGCTQVSDFVVPIFLSLTCPDDITIDCEVTPDPSATGMPDVTGFDSIAYFDVVTQDCPSKIIERRWVASISGGSLDTCLQVITLTDENLRANFQDTVYISGQCSGMLDSLIIGTLPLGCNERIDFVATDPISASCDEEIFRTDWLLFDECTGNRTTISQYTVFENLQIIQLSNEMISPAIGDSTGAISFDFSSCKNDSVSFIWSNGSTTETISGLVSGTYTVTLTNTSECTEVKSFDVPLSFALTCPADIVISCSDSPDIAITGNAVLQGFDSLSFADSIIQVCPNTIIQRTFTGSSMNAQSVSCTQLITLSNETVRVDFPDTVRISGACAADLASLVTTSPPLKCGESVSSMNMTMSDLDCKSQTFRIDWLVFDECANETNFLSQVTVFEDIAVVGIDNFSITSDQEDNSGAITFDHMVCMGDSVSFLWSNGATSPNLTGLAGGVYGLTVTNSLGCIDTFSYEVPLLFSLVCPSNISLACIEEPTTEITGMPSFTGFELISFVDEETQTCPDRIIQRTFSAFTSDSSMMETCTQIITLRDNSAAIRDGFPLMANLSGVCTDDALANPETIIPLGCNEVLDSTSILVASRGCDRDVVNFVWHITDNCKDTSFMIGQAVVFTDVPVITIDSVNIEGAQNGNDGSISFNFEQCGGDSLDFIWNNLATEPNLEGVAPGEYELRVTNARGCRDTFTFIVPTDMSVVCPNDITISCTETPDTSVTGMPLIFGFDNFTFTDTVVQTCPNMIIERTFVSGTGNDASSCTQTITLMNNDDIRAEFSDTITITGQCLGDVNSLVVDMIPLSCNETVDSSSVIVVNESCETAEAAIIWTISNACTGMSSTVTQTVLFDSIPFVTLSNTQFTRDDGSGNGGVDFDIEFCQNNSLNFLWSDSSSNKSLIGVEGGLYMVTITNDQGCSQVFNFEVPAPLPFDSTRSLTINVVDRDNQNLEDVSFKFLSSIGESEIRADLFSSTNGEYVYVLESQLSEVGYICPSIDDAAVRLVSSLDIVRGQRLILGISESCPEDHVAIDVNFSGGPTAADLVLIRRVILNLDQSFPANESWRFIKNEEIDLNNLSVQIPGCVPFTADELNSQIINLKGLKLGNLECPD